ncbi:hypothetical protein LX16_4588 [Stackebrandtia albiflava]|uniref:Uncharacterized protein n=1 Tax=Stackebrandtia albiflava TaxID=406432 RepID=A0A562URX7_9ACTN|nr:hypothetical protein [Stackebrandtia albiflava]TWJ08360.1 hypothetical protein LX16_4588 [Stackebrandtia albiflava]
MNDTPAASPPVAKYLAGQDAGTYVSPDELFSQVKAIDGTVETIGVSLVQGRQKVRMVGTHVERLASASALVDLVAKWAEQCDAQSRLVAETGRLIGTGGQQHTTQEALQDRNWARAQLPTAQTGKLAGE